MNKPIYRRWEPVGGLPHRLYIEAVHDDYEGLRFLLRDDDSSGPMLRITFESAVAYRNVNESYRSRTWAAIGDTKSLPSLLTVEHSKWVEWLVAEAGGVLAEDQLVHYALHTPEDCVDVVSEFAPMVEWLGQ